MVLLFEKFTTHPHKPSSKLKQRHSDSLHSFEAEVLSCLHQVSLFSKPASEAYSISLIQTCLRVLPSIEKSFAEFTAKVDYPVTEWKISLLEEYLKGSITLLDHFNSISSSVNRLSQVCMELSYSFGLAEATPNTMSKNLKEIPPWCNTKLFQEFEAEERVFSEKELIIYKAVLLRKRINNWLCTIINMSICGGEIKFECNGVCEVMKKEGVLKEVDEINKGVVQLTAASKEERYCVEEAKELRGKVEVLRELLEGVKEDVNRLFSEAMARRNELICSFQNRKQ